MAEQEVNPVAILSLLFLIFATLSFIRYVFIVFSMWAFAVGIGLGWLLLRNFPEVPNLLLLLQLTGSIKTPKTVNYGIVPKKRGCAICSKKGCSRHRPEVSIETLHPWENIKIPKLVDEALTEFLEIFLRTHVYSWYWDLSHDQGFVDQTRYILRCAFAVILQRLQKVDIPKFILKKCLKKFMIHTDCFFRTKERAVYGDDLQQLMLDKMKTYKHFCLQNELAEEEYLRYTIQALLPYLLPKSERECKASHYLLEELLTEIILKPLAEKIAEPDFVNNMLLIFLDKETLPEPDYPPSEKVVFLEQFGKHRVRQTVSALTVSVYDLMHEAKYLYPFMQFMKKEGSLNILQFCLAVEEFNKRSLAADATEDDQVKMLEEAHDLDALYFKKDAVDKIDFPVAVVKDFQDAVLSPKDTMMRLKTAAPLFRAYEYAVDILEKTFVPLFHQSEEFYALLCGIRYPKLQKVAENNMSKRKFMPFAEFSKLASKIKGKKLGIKNNSYDPSLAIFMDETNADEEDDFTDDDELDGDVRDEDDVSDDEVYNLSYWHVTIPKIDYIIEKNKKLFVFVINVERISGKEAGSTESNWQVIRKYNEFYVLDKKLKRFHETRHATELPPKRTILKKDFGYLNSIRFRLQEYLQRLVRSPVLRGSSLLHSFLTPGLEITFEPDSVGREAGRKVKSLRSKLIIEKGQNLELFLTSFITSCEPPLKKRLPIKPSALQGIFTHKRRDSRMYLPPPAWARDHRRNPSSSSDIFTPSMTSVVQYILYAGRNFMKLPRWIHHVMTCVQYLFKNTIHCFIEKYIAYKLSLVIAEKQLVTYIHLVRDIIFFDNEPPRTDTDKVERRDLTLEQLLKFFPERLKNWMRPENHDQSLKILFEMFQYPKLNKQLLYILLDEVLFELFPELSSQLEKKS